MAERADEPMIEPIKASMLLDHENRYRQANSGHNLPTARQKGVMLKGLDKRFAPLWSGGRIVGVGSAYGGDEMRTGKRSIPLHVIAAALLTVSPSGRLPNIYIIAPHTNQTMIPLLHAHLANTISSSPAAMELLKSVRLLQYFDLAGLAESVAEVSETLFLESQKDEEQHQPGAGLSNNVASHILIQGIASTISVTSRQSGIVQANALLAGLIRNITQLSRASGEVLVLVEVPVEMEDTTERQQDINRPRTGRSIELESAFTGSAGSSLRLACGHGTLSRTLEAGLDCLVVLHDGLGRGADNKRGSASQGQVIEMVKDGSGDLTGLWDIWKEG
ncbi:hypothetical protein H2200_007360 [Cladophialophora chaetospira]|uniref:Uncharacterized protein n=1 Tax=Cladophialophora chaetospira TaxID=386627 RepID=A0AA38X7N6_9EURO|nr:hypothetical protein H2200_007360 [Cladophialophora chaetospira]